MYYMAFCSSHIQLLVVREDTYDIMDMGPRPPSRPSSTDVRPHSASAAAPPVYHYLWVQ